MSSRLTNAGIVSVVAECQECAWRAEARNALANAARHHDASGHQVTVDQALRVTYGAAPNPEELGQVPLDDVGSAPGTPDA